MSANEFLDAQPEGSQVGAVILHRPIGQGGEGIVYEASHLIHGSVLVKEYWPKQIASRAEGQRTEASRKSWQVDYRRGVERFISVGERFAGLPPHSGIMRIHEVMAERNTAYLVMHAVEGRTLDAVLDDNALGEPDQVLRLADKMSAALAHLHAHGLLHRDIAPDNIMITPGQDWEPVLIDFNAAKDLVLRLSHSREALVKPGYTPAEQFDSSTSDLIGPWTDIYAAAAVLYRVIAGEPPLDPIRRRFRPEEFKPLETMGGEAYPAGFLKAIDDALEPDPASRPQTVDAWRKAMGFSGSATDAAPRTRPVASPVAEPRMPSTPVKLPPAHDVALVPPVREGRPLWLLLLPVIAIVGAALWYFAPWRTDASAPVVGADAVSFLDANGQKPGVVTTPFGAQYQVLRAGQGPHPTTEDSVLMGYTVTLTDGALIAQVAPSAIDRAALPTGLARSIELMQKGGLYRIWLPPELGYPAGAPQAGAVPPGALLVIDAELVEFGNKQNIEKDERKLQQDSAGKPAPIKAPTETRQAEQASYPIISYPSATPSVPAPAPVTYPPFQAARPRGSPASWVSTDDYPSASLRAEEEGVVSVRLDVSSDGRVQGCAVTASSGWPALDSTTCTALTRRARFTPATDGEGKPIRGSYTTRIRWVIPKDDPPPPAG